MNGEKVKGDIFANVPANETVKTSNKNAIVTLSDEQIDLIATKIVEKLLSCSKDEENKRALSALKAAWRPSLRP
jgi:hypothetical protein